MTIRQPNIVGRDPLVMTPGGPPMDWPPQADHFSAGARRGLAEAQGVAARLGHNHVAAPHILVGSLVDDDGVPATALRDVGVTHAASVEVLASIMGRNEPYAPEDITLTPHGQLVVDRAVYESRRMHHVRAGAEHLAIAAAGQDDGFVPRILAGLKTTPDAVTARILARLDVPESYRAAENATPTVGPYERFDDHARRVLAVAEREAESARDRGINPHHFLLGIAALAESGDVPAVADLLVALGIAPADIRAEVAKLPGPRGRVPTDERPPRFTGSAKLVIEHAIHLAGAGSVRPEHLVAAIDTAGDSIAGYILRRLGVAPDRVRDLLADRG